MPVIKPSFDGRNETSNRYDGPPPTPGPYTGEVSGAWATQIKNGDNAGEPQIVVAVKITTGKFKGARILHNLQLLKSTAWSLNQFLDALTDGSETQKTTLRNWFWDNGYATDTEDKAVKNLGLPITKILSPKGPKNKGFPLVGKAISFITKMDSSNGQERAIVDRFVVSLEDSEPEGAEDDSDAGLDTVDSKTETSPETETETDAAPDEDDSDELDSAPAEEDSPPTEGDDDDDDPWG